MPTSADNTPHPARSPQTELERLAERFLRYLSLERGRSPHTITAYRSDLAVYHAYLTAHGVTEVSAVTESHIGSFVSGLDGSPRTVARRLSTIRSFHRYLVDDGVVVSDPTAQVATPAVAERLPKALRVDQIQQLLESVSSDDPVSLRDRALLELLYATGARISEAVGLAVDDVVDMGGGALEAIRVTGKGNKQRIVPLGRFAQDAIDAWLVRGRPALQTGTRSSGPSLFLGNRGGPLSRQNAWLIVQARARDAGLPDGLSPHTLRHSCATHLIAGGADVRVVQELLGHHSVTTTQIYTRVTIDSLRDVFYTAHPRAR